MGDRDRALGVLRPSENSHWHGQRDHVEGKPNDQPDVTRSDHTRNGSRQVASRISDEQRNTTDNAGLDPLKVNDAFEDASCVRTVQLREGVALDLIRDRPREPPGREQQAKGQIWSARWTRVDEWIVRAMRVCSQIATSEKGNAKPSLEP
jgi:hypothetical protein